LRDGWSHFVELGVPTDVDRETELATVEGLRAGDSQAFDVVYEAYAARLISFLARLSRRRDLAEELAEETWLRLVANAGRLHPDTRLGPWLFAVARNLYCNACRSRLVEEAYSASLIGLWPAGTARPSPFEETSANELQQRIERALASLPAHQREVMLLVGVYGFTSAEAAGICGVTPETLRQRLSRARARIARALGEIT
jgi:RNA polymerase sigma factor (sigma-70 family)